MLHIKHSFLCYIIAKAREFQAHDITGAPEDAFENEPETASGQFAEHLPANHGPNDALQEMISAIEEMSQRQRAELVALMWLGRGDYTLVEWEKAVDDAVGDYSLNAAGYVLAHPTLADDLEEGLVAHGLSCDE